MPEMNLSEKIPATATWVKIRYQMAPKKEGAELISRVWSGHLDDAVILKGPKGEVSIKLNRPQLISYQRPVTIDLKLKIVAYQVD